MTLQDVKREAKSHGLSITQTKTHYIIKLAGREISRSPKSAGLAKLTDALANAAS